MLIREIIARHRGPEGALHEHGIELDAAQAPPGVTIHHDGDAAIAPVAGDLLIINAPIGTGLSERIDADLPVGVTAVLLFEVEVVDVPVDRLLAALSVAKLQVVQATVLSGTPTATVAVVATRSDELVVPQPALAQNLEPGEHTGPAVLQRRLGEHILADLVQPARERALVVEVEELQARLVEAAKESERLRAEWRGQEATLVRERDTARTQTEAERKRMQKLRSSKSFKVASRITQASGVARRIIRRPGSGKPTV